MASTPDYIGTTETARILRKSPRTIYRWVKVGRLTPVLVGPGGQHGSWLFDRAEILAMAEAAA